MTCIKKDALTGIQVEARLNFSRTKKETWPCHTLRKV
jgi:hypothetical protein